MLCPKMRTACDAVTTQHSDRTVQIQVSVCTGLGLRVTCAASVRVSRSAGRHLQALERSIHQDGCTAPSTRLQRAHIWQG